MKVWEMKELLKDEDDDTIVVIQYRTKHDDTRLRIAEKTERRFVNAGAGGGARVFALEKGRDLW